MWLGILAGDSPQVELVKTPVVPLTIELHCTIIPRSRVFEGGVDRTRCIVGVKIVERRQRKVRAEASIIEGYESGTIGLAVLLVYDGSTSQCSPGKNVHDLLKD